MDMLCASEIASFERVSDSGDGGTKKITSNDGGECKKAGLLQNLEKKNSWKTGKLHYLTKIIFARDVSSF